MMYRTHEHYQSSIHSKCESSIVNYLKHPSNSSPLGWDQAQAKLAQYQPSSLVLHKKTAKTGTLAACETYRDTMLNYILLDILIHDKCQSQQTSISLRHLELRQFLTANLQSFLVNQWDIYRLHYTQNIKVK